MKINSKKTVFLDRDGVISVYTPKDWVKSWQEFKFIPAAIKGLKKLAISGFRIVIISNQAGVRKGIFSKAALEELTLEMERVLQKSNIKITKIYYCMHSEEDNCTCRKPLPGLLFKAVEELGDITLNNTFFVGDSEIDIQAGKAAGTKTILVLSGKTKSIDETLSWSVTPDFIAKDLEEASDIIINEEN